MRNITHIVNKTILKNDCFEYFATSKKDKVRNHYYTPYSIIGWNHRRVDTNQLISYAMQMLHMNLVSMMA